MSRSMEVRVFVKCDACGERDESTSETEADACRALRKRGWLVYVAQDLCLCPEHNSTGEEPQ